VTMGFDITSFLMGKAAGGGGGGGGGGDPALPAEYQEVEYLENDGYCWCQIQTNPIIEDYLEITVAISSDAGSSENGIVGAESSQYNKVWEIWYQNGAVGFYQGITGDRVENVATETKYVFTGQFNTYPYSAFLWGRYRTSTLPFKGKMYGARIYVAGGAKQLNRCKLVACYRKADNVPGFYDIVNSVFYTNIGTGTFGIGPDVN